MDPDQTSTGGATFELDVESLAYQGHGVARREGLVHFVDGALPGERVRAEVVRRGPRVAFAETREVLAPSPRRVAPPCPVFGRCGGCQFLHAGYALQVEAKTQFVRDAFRGRPEDAARVEPCEAAETPTGFRNRMSYSIGLADGVPVVGLHTRGDAGAIVPAGDCVLGPDWHRAVLARTGSVLAAHADRPAGWPRRLDLREGRRTGQRMAVLAPAPAPAVADAWMAACAGEFHTVVFSDLPDPRTGEAACRPVRGPGRIEERLGRWTFEIGPHTFFQTFTEQAERMFGVGADWTRELAPPRVVELYAGVGALTVFLADAAGEVVAIERHAPSVAAARRNLRRNAVRNVRFLCREAAAFRPDAAGAPADLLVVDPPRAGLDAGALDAVTAWNAPALLYVSCDPMTLARDVGRLAERGWRLERVRPFDLFPQTFHVECLALLRRAGAGGE